MKRLVVLLVIGVVATVARAEDRSLEAYDGQIVISPDPAPRTLGELPAYLKANAAPDRHYELIKGSPWEIHLIGVLSKDPGSAPVTLVFSDAADAKRTPIQAIEVSSKRRLVIATTRATLAAGFVTNTTYAVRLLRGKTVLASAELKLRD